MTKPVEKITIGGRGYSRFIHYPKQVRDGTSRCITCGQIDEPEYHDDAICEPKRLELWDRYFAQRRALTKQEALA